MYCRVADGLNVVIYHEDRPIDICRAAYLSMAKINIKRHNIDFPVGTPLEIVVMDKRKICKDSLHIPTIIASRSNLGLSLKVNNKDRYQIVRWRRFLFGILVENSDAKVPPISISH